MCVDDQPLWLVAVVVEIEHGSYQGSDSCAQYLGELLSFELNCAISSCTDVPEPGCRKEPPAKTLAPSASEFVPATRATPYGSLEPNYLRIRLLLSLFRVLP